MANEADEALEQNPIGEGKLSDLREGLDLAVEIFKDGFKQLREDFRSIQNRAGVGLTLSIAALSGSAFRIRDRFPTLEGDEKVWVLVAAGLSGILLTIAACLFIEALRARNLPYGYNYEIILAGEWKKDAVEFQRQRLSDLGDSIKQTKTTVDAIGSQLNWGVFLAILGVLVISVLEIVLGPAPTS